MRTSTLSRKSQAVIPIEIRRKLDLKPGDRILYIEENGRIYIEKADIDWMSELESCVNESYEGYDKILEKEREAWD